MSRRELVVAYIHLVVSILCPCLLLYLVAFSFGLAPWCQLLSAWSQCGVRGSAPKRRNLCDGGKNIFLHSLS